jgi:transposase
VTQARSGLSLQNAIVYLRRVGKTDRNGERRHWALVESQRTPRGPRQQVVAYLGDVAQELCRGVEDVASGKPRQGELFDAASAQWVEVDARRVRVERARSFGGAWLALQLISDLGLDTFLASELDGGRGLVPWSLVAQILVVQRLLEPSSELSVAEGGYERTALSDLLGVPSERVNDDRLYRALDRLLPAKGKLEKHLKDRLGSLFGLTYDLLLYDVTSTFFEGKCEGNPQALRGYSRDNRGDCKQVTIALVVSREGLPLGYEVFAGNRADVTSVEEIVGMIETRYGKADRVWAMDRGMASEDNLEFLKSEGRRYILGTPKSQMKKFELELAEGDWETVREGLEVKKCASPSGDETFILCRSSDRREKDKAIHGRFATKIEAGLAKIAKSCEKQTLKTGMVERRIGRLLGKNTRAERLFEVTTETREDGGARVIWKKRREALDWSELSDGCYMLRTNVNDWSGEDLWRAYIQLTQAESAFRICKNDLGLRPVWHQKEERVQAHILVCFLAYVLWKTLDLKCRNAGLGDSARKVLAEISAIQMVDVVLPTKCGVEIRKRCVSMPEPHLAVLLHKLKLTLPSNIETRKM